MSKVILSGHIIVPLQDLAAVKKELPNHIALTRSEVGCLVFEVKQDPDQLERFDVYEVFVDQQAFDAHQTWVSDSQWGQVTVNVERHYVISGVSHHCH